MTTRLELQIINYLATQPGKAVEFPSTPELEVWELFERLGYSRLQIVRAINSLVERGTLLSLKGRLILSWALSFEKAAKELV